MSMPPQVGPNANLLLQRLDLIEKKIDWIAQRVTWLTYTVGTPVQPGAEPSQAGKSTTHASPMGTVDTNETTEVATSPGDDVASPTAAVSPTATMSLKASTPVANPVTEEKRAEDEEVAAAGPAQNSEPSHHPVGKEPAAQPHESPRPTVLAEPSRLSSSYSSMGYLPDARIGAKSYQESTGTSPTEASGANEVPGWAQRATQEGNLGRYLLSGAAAVLVLSAGASLLALVWDSIPDVAKILALALIAVTMTATGARLGTSRPRFRVAAATITGTGGGLGFVSIVGAVLLDGMLGPEPALALMACWGLVLLLVSHLTRVLFTAVVSTIGALVTIGFAVSHVQHQQTTALVTWLMISVYVTVLALTCGVLSQSTRRMRLAAWYPVTSMVATAVALVFAPVSPMLRISAAGGTGIVLSLCLILACQMTHASRRLWSIDIKTAGWDWGLAAAILLIAYGNLLVEQKYLLVAHSTVAVTYLLELLLLAGAALAVLMPNSPDQWRSAMAIGHEVSVLPIALIGMVIIDTPRAYVCVVITTMLCFLPVIVGGRVEPAPILAFLGTLPILLLLVIGGSPAELLSLIASIVASALMAVVAEWLGTRSAHTTPPPASHPVQSSARSRTLALRLALATIIFNLAVLTPALADGLVSDSQSAWAGLRMVPGLVTIAFILLGAFSSEATPLRVLSGQCRGARYQVDPQGKALPKPHGSLTGVPAPSWIVSGLLSIIAAQTLLWANEATSEIWMMALVAVALGLGATATWILLPWARQAGACLSLAIGNSLLMWLSVTVITDTDPGSVLMSVMVLATGGGCIVFGFRARLTILRHYGLTLVLLSVLKLAGIDMASQNSIVRVISLAVAGIACFVLSLLYNRYAQEQRREQADGVDKHNRPRL